MSETGIYEIKKYELIDEVKEKDRRVVDNQSSKILGEMI